MTPHKAGTYKSKAKLPAEVKPRRPSRHPAKPKAKPAPRKRAVRFGDDQTSQFTDAPAAAFEKAVKEFKPGFRVTDAMLFAAKGRPRKSRVLAAQIFAAARPMKGIVPKGKATLAMDENIEVAIGWAAQSIYNGAFEQGVTFLGYPYLAELTQRAEYRRVSEVIATEMTRKWIEIKAHNTADLDEDQDEGGEQPGEDDQVDQDQDEVDQDGSQENPGQSQAAPGQSQDGPPAQDAFPPQAGKPGVPAQPGALGAMKPGKAPPAKPKVAKDKRVKELEEEFKRLNVQDCFRKLAEQDGFFGRSHLFIEVDHNDGTDTKKRAELVIPIGDGQDKWSEAKIAKGSITRLKTVEAIWCYPANYNSSNPLAQNWYAPSLWFVQGMEVHASRLLTFVGREVPDMLKPAYSFGGLAMSQMIQPTVLNWLRTRQSVADIIHAFSVFVLKTNMGNSVQEDGDEVFKRADFFNATRDNTGLMMIDKESEEFENVSAPLSTLDALQAQSQEHICSVSGLPLVKYTGISPSGLNATSEFELICFYEWIKAYQIAFFNAGLTRIFHFAQLNLWGKVDPDLYFEFAPLKEMTEKERAEMRKVEADADTAWINASVISPEEVRQRLSDDSDGPYAGIPPDNVPEPPQPDQGEGFDPDAEPGDEDGPPNDKKPEGTFPP